jgi:hypothetical protein
LFDDFYDVRHHLSLGIILLPETNGALEPHDPSRSHPKRDVHGFVFTIIATIVLTIVVVVAAALTVVTAQVIATAAFVVTAHDIAATVILWDRNNLFGRRQWDCRFYHRRDLHPNLVAHALL